jgi:hypothetical protein
VVGESAGITREKLQQQKRLLPHEVTEALQQLDLDDNDTDSESDQNSVLEDIADSINSLNSLTPYIEDLRKGQVDRSLEDDRDQDSSLIGLYLNFIRQRFPQLGVDTASRLARCNAQRHQELSTRTRAKGLTTDYADSAVEKLQKRSLTGKARVFQCTFCMATFDGFRHWASHEESVHLLLRKWVCAPEGRFKPDTRVCVYCESTHDGNGGNNDACGAELCHSKPPEYRVFSRKIHLMQHLNRVHGVHWARVLPESWMVTTQHPASSRCGFCNKTFNNWQQRMDHIANEFMTAGNDMAFWQGDWGLDKEWMSKENLGDATVPSQREDHVLQELRPYICLDMDCPLGDVRFPSLEDWERHEVEYHTLRQTVNYTCPPPCGEMYAGADRFREHLLFHHLEGRTSLSSADLDDITHRCVVHVETDCATWRSVPECQFCGENITQQADRRRHSGIHMVQVSLEVVRHTARTSPMYEDKDKETAAAKSVRPNHHGDIIGAAIQAITRHKSEPRDKIATKPSVERHRSGGGHEEGTRARQRRYRARDAGEWIGTTTTHYGSEPDDEVAIEPWVERKTSTRRRTRSGSMSSPERSIELPQYGSRHGPHEAHVVSYRRPSVERHRSGGGHEEGTRARQRRYRARDAGEWIGTTTTHYGSEPDDEVAIEPWVERKTSTRERTRSGWVSSPERRNIELDISATDSGYWSHADRREFRKLLQRFGRNWEVISSRMTTPKTAIMVCSLTLPRLQLLICLGS